MELKDFIKDVISSIADAISEINGESTDGGIIVNPCKFSANGAKGTKTNDGRLIYDVGSICMSLLRKKKQWEEKQA